MIKEIATRRSIRKYNGKPVEDEKIMQLIESARLAPSGSNTQPWNFIIIRSEETKEKIAKADGNQMWMKDAPVFIVCVADIRCRIKDETELSFDEESSARELKQIIRDTAIAIEHILLEAESIGLSSCWTAYFVQDDIRPILDIPRDKYVVGVVTIGYSDEKGKQAPRRALESMIRYEKW
ncbi:MAG: nitroreductase family protein [Defluviitaleaceae bacterium]|nr:nitroreductase family protein [Defluviitaleaceae bacterium]